jgi:hypothetical protein
VCGSLFFISLDLDLAWQGQGLGENSPAKFDLSLFLPEEGVISAVEPMSF